MSQYFRLAFAASIPFVVFGFLDNLIMIMAGEEIDRNLCARFGLTTMAAAGFGNLVSDAAGVCAADSIESQAKRFKVSTPPKLSPAQERMFSARAVRMGGSVAGISVGCILGMFPLLLYPHPNNPPAAAGTVATA